VVLIDTLRADFLGCYGFQGPVSPHLDAVAGESYVFRRCYASAPWTKPSVATLFTSLNPTVHHVTSTEDSAAAADVPDVEKGTLREDAYTLAERLHDAGYRTGSFVANPWVTAEAGFAQGFDRAEEMTKASADRLAEAAGAWLAEDGGRHPFLLYLHAMEVHAPYDAPDSTYRAVAGSPGAWSDFVLPPDQRDRIPPSLLGSRWVAGSDDVLRVATWRGRYAAGVRDVDDRFGIWLRELRASGVLDRAYLVITSDHGEELYDHGHFEHGYSLFENQVHVPLIIRPPGGLPATRDVPQLVGLIDVLPTLVNLAGASGEGAAGRDLVPLLEHPETEAPRVVFSGGVRKNGQLFSLRAGNYEFLSDGVTQTYALYDVKQDPGEIFNIAGLQSRVAQRMRAYLTEVLERDRGHPLFDPSAAPVPEERRALLQSLGYAN